jgi:hypothetical protein
LSDLGQNLSVREHDIAKTGNAFDQNGTEAADAFLSAWDLAQATTGNSRSMAQEVTRRMHSRAPQPIPPYELTTLLAQGKMLAEQGAHHRASIRFARVLALRPDHVEALLWLAALSPEPEESIRYLNRVLQISPGHAGALAGLRWARERRQARPAKPTPSSAPESLALADKLLLSSIVLASLVACMILTAMAWGVPAAVRAAYQPTPTFAIFPTATTLATSTPTHTPVPTARTTEAVTPTSAPPTATPTRVVPGEPAPATLLGTKWIELDLSDQMLTAYEGQTPVFSALVSTGIPGLPTPQGEYAIYRKVRSQVMSGSGYYLPNVEYVSYFYKGYAIHGTYWHNNFGHPMSHGCVNMTNSDAMWIYEWAPTGTRVIVRA